MQTTQRTQEALGIPGAAVDYSVDAITRVAGGPIRPGQLAIRPIQSVASDADAIIDTIASAATAQTLSGTSLNGVVGGGLIDPPRNVALVLSNNADWDATTAIVTGEDEYGRVQTENLAIPNGGNATVAGTKFYRRVTSLFVPAQSGAGGTATLGTGALVRTDVGADLCRSLPAAPASDADAIIETIASSLSLQTLSGASLDGVIGGNVIFPPRNLTLTLSNNAHWDATTAVVTGEDEYGRVITENFAIPDTGNATLTGTKTFRRVTSLVIPAQSGTGGTADLGIGTLLGPITARDVLGIVRYLGARQLDQNATSEFSGGDVLSLIKQGRVWVEVEEDVEDGEQVFVRLVATGTEVVGGFRNDRDGTAGAPDAVPVIGLRFASDSELRDGLRLAKIDVTL